MKTVFKLKLQALKKYKNPSRHGIELRWEYDCCCGYIICVG